MLPIESFAYLVLATDGERKLLPGTVLDQTAQSCRIGFPSLPTEYADNVSVSMLYQRGGRLFQRCAIIIERADCEAPVGQSSLELQFSAPEVSADSRGRFRVSTVEFNLFARFENDRQCPVVDISAEGIAVIIPKPLRIGTFGRLRLECEEVTIDGRARVQAMKQRGDAFRCGLLIPAADAETRASLLKLTTSLQRETPTTTAAVGLSSAHISSFVDAVSTLPPRVEVDRANDDG